MVNERNYGVDLLRLVLMYMVCMLHALGQGGLLYAGVEGTCSHKVIWFLEIVSYCAVDGFAFISGYMAINKTRKYEKIVDMWFQAFFYSFILTLIFTVIGMNDTWSITEFITCALPVTFGKFWYFSAFFVLFFAIPLLNKFLFALDGNSAKKAFICFVILFSFLGLIKDAFALYGGYSVIWLIVLYCLGVLAKQIKLFEMRNSLSLILIWFLCVLITWGSYIFFGKSILISYVSPTVLLCGIIMVVLFSRIKIKGNLIAKLSPLAFGIYLFQGNEIIWNNILKDALIGFADKPLFIEVVSAFVFALVIFVSGLIAEFIRRKLAEVLKLHKLSEKIVKLCSAFTERLFVFLK